MTLPSDGPVGIEAVLQTIAESSELFGNDAYLQVRSVAVHVHERGWFNYATVARMTSRPDDLHELIEMGSVAVTSSVEPVDDVQDADELRRLLTDWRWKVAASTGFQLWDEWDVTRMPSNSEWGPDPYWVVRTEEELSEKPSYGASGPFFDAGSGIFGEDLGGLAIEWLEMPWAQDQSYTRHSYDVVIPDRRARFTGYEAREDKVRFFVDSQIDEGELRAAAISKQLGGGEHRQARSVDDGQVEFAFPDSVKALRIWLFHADGDWLDRYEESEYGASWGPSIYNAPRASRDSAYAAVREALESGENEVVEFKKWLDPTTGSSKAVEVPRTVVAFANRGRGDIFIGINDSAEIVDVTPKLRVLYGDECGKEIDCLVKCYIRDLKKLIREDVAPSPMVRIEPVIHAEQQVIRVHVERTSAEFYHLIRNGSVLFRRGATNKSISAADLAEIIQQSPG